MPAAPPSASGFARLPVELERVPTAELLSSPPSEGTVRVGARGPGDEGACRAALERALAARQLAKADPDGLDGARDAGRSWACAYLADPDPSRLELEIPAPRGGAMTGSLEDRAKTAAFVEEIVEREGLDGLRRLGAEPLDALRTTLYFSREEERRWGGPPPWAMRAMESLMELQLEG